ncbi:MAG: WhiB family transcriptional regulator [Actinomycetota bacterium]|nr:WhiB family transcriptional regulator [Actinomycetota bacterium]
MAVENLRQLVDRPEWMDDAACRGVDPEVFYPPMLVPTPTGLERQAKSRRYREAIATAKTYCRRCDVQAECLAYALATGESHGVWGGLDQIEIRRIRARRKEAS